ncbi:MAG: hypothetical protein U5K56_05175 [Halioglobus sp.]|nr:hypothetical protein [Halioglobus sp.]
MIRGILAVLFALGLSACDHSSQLQTLAGAAQGTTWHVSAWRRGGVDADQLRR